MGVNGALQVGLCCAALIRLHLLPKKSLSIYRGVCLARMIPNCGPVDTGSRGEEYVYKLLREQLDDEFTVIHSLPWLNAAVSDLDLGGKPAATGEIDFLILHRQLGILALEVKGGMHRIESGEFVHVSSGTKTYAIAQVRRSTHGVAKWLGVDADLRFRIGYGLVFPHSDFLAASLPPALAHIQSEADLPILLSRRDMHGIGESVIKLMHFWRRHYDTPVLGSRIDRVVQRLCPNYDSGPLWGDRVIWDGRLWLRLTSQQCQVVDAVVSGSRLVVTGWPGTGKTLVMIESVRRLIGQGKRVLVLVFNALLRDYISNELEASSKLQVATWHGFCSRSGVGSSRTSDQAWLETGCLQQLKVAAASGTLGGVDVVLVDEAQSFAVDWMEWLCTWHRSALTAFCDESQVFSFERERVKAAQLCRMVGVERAYSMTIALRSPRMVYEKLKAVRPPDFQLSLPREFEDGALQEYVEPCPTTALYSVINSFLISGVLSDDIVILEKTAGFRYVPLERPCRTEVLSRFRGMEAPVVIIFEAEKMTDAELFCAYSRATTACVAIYSAEVLGVRGVSGRFQNLLAGEPEFLDRIERARRTAASSEIISGDALARRVSFGAMNLFWIDRWAAWGLQTENSLGEAWLPILCARLRAPLYTWDRSSLREVWRVLPKRVIGEQSSIRSERNLKHCKECQGTTPSIVADVAEGRYEWCEICATEDAQFSASNEALPEDLTRIAELLSRPSARLDAAERATVPLELASAAIYDHVKRINPERLPARLPSSSGGSAYGCALLLVYAVIARREPGRDFVTKIEAEKLFARYKMPAGMVATQWLGHMTSAVNVAYQRGLLERIGKGQYKVVALAETVWALPEGR